MVDFHGHHSPPLALLDLCLYSGLGCSSSVVSLKEIYRRDTGKRKRFHVTYSLGPQLVLTLSLLHYSVQISLSLNCYLGKSGCLTSWWDSSFCKWRGWVLLLLSLGLLPLSLHICSGNKADLICYREHSDRHSQLPPGWVHQCSWGSHASPSCSQPTTTHGHDTSFRIRLTGRWHKTFLLT